MTLRQPIFGGGSPSPPANRPIREITFSSGSKNLTTANEIDQVDVSGGTFVVVFDPTLFDPGAQAVTVIKMDDSDNQCLIEDQHGASLGILNAQGQSYDLTSLGSSVMVN